jgi:hypothetical protein
MVMLAGAVMVSNARATGVLPIMARTIHPGGFFLFLKECGRPFNAGDHKEPINQLNTLN